MLGVDQFNHDWTYPYQGLVYPPWAGVAGGGQWWDSAERSLLQSYVSSQVPPCPKTPGNGSFIPDTGSRMRGVQPASCIGLVCVVSSTSIACTRREQMVASGLTRRVMRGRLGQGLGHAKARCTTATRLAQ